MIEVEARGEGVDTAPIVARLVWTCQRLGLEDATLGLMVVGEVEMAAINGEHRDKPQPTDVLAFPVDGPEALDWPAGGPPPELGDVVICPAAAQEPQVSPLDTATPLPPSTSGRTSTPPMRIALMAFK